jgi:3-(3-hydroxy-phenyl)propionate hydroxylase
MPGTVDCDVIIVGLGPTGAVLANLLGQYGWSVVAIERDEDIYYAPRAVHFDDEIARIFQFAGLAGPILSTSEPFSEMGFRLKARAQPVVRMNVGSQDRRYGYPGAFWFHQPTLERHFRDGLKRFPKVQTICGAEIITITQDHTGVLATYRIASGDSANLRGQYLIGCDGGKSTVRREAKIELDSADFDEAWVVVDVKARSGTKDPDFPINHFQVCDPKQPVTFVPMTGPYYEWQFMVMGHKSERDLHGRCPGQ